MQNLTGLGIQTANRDGTGFAPLHPAISEDVAYGYPRDFLQNQFVYLVLSPRVKGLSIGINLNPMLKDVSPRWNCETDRIPAPRASRFDVDRMGSELDHTLRMADTGWLKHLPRYGNLPEDMLRIRHVIISGDGEPTLAEQFPEAVRAVAHVRAVTRFFKIVLATNSIALDSPRVREGLRSITREDEVWAKLDGGTEQYIRRINGPTIPLETILRNILSLGRQRPIVIQSLFPAINGQAPSDLEIEEYAQRLKELKEQGADISQVQIYSAIRPLPKTGRGHLPLKTLSQIARTVRKVAGLRAEVF